jgi:hypothetical protein
MDHMMSYSVGESQKYLTVHDFGENNLENGQLWIWMVMLGWRD